MSAATFDDQWGVTTDVLSWIAQAAAGRLELGEFRGLLSRRGFDSHDVSDLVELVTAARG